MNSCVASATRCMLGAVANAGSANAPIEMDTDPASFLICFCGSGTGHMTQALTMSRLLSEQFGMKLCGVITDSDASQRMIDELIRPLDVPLLVLPAITIVTKEGVLPPHAILGKAVAVDRKLRKQTTEVRDFLAASRAGVVVSMWQISLGKFLTQNPLPPEVRVFHIAAQFALADLRAREASSLAAAAAKGTVDVMASVFAPSGRCVAISASAASGADGGGSSTLAPIIEMPEQVSADCQPLLLCYFLTQRPARLLERMLHKHPIDGLEVHVFTSEALTPPKGRALSLHSHPKQRKLFQELFARCTAVLCSTGNETIWEAHPLMAPTCPTPCHLAPGDCHLEGSTPPLLVLSSSRSRLLPPPPIVLCCRPHAEGYQS